MLGLSKLEDMLIVLQDLGTVLDALPIDLCTELGSLILERNLRSSMDQGLQRSISQTVLTSNLIREPTPSPGFTFETDKVRC